MKNILNNLTFVNYKGKPINGHIVYDFYEQLNNSNAIKIFRGENKNALINSYKINGNPNLLAEFKFMIGSKAKVFYDEFNKKPAGYSVENDSLTETLWLRLHKMCNPGSFNSDKTKIRLNNFLVQNPTLKSFFSEDTNQQVFIDKLNSLELKDRVKVIDYYYSLLHTIGNSAYGNSYILSTSRNYYTAKEFSNGEEGLVIYAWIPQNNRGLAITYQDVKKLEFSVQDLGFPICSQAMYPEQDEICLKFGLLANFIIGFEMDGKFYVNPLLERYGNTISNGFTKDEEQFKEMIKTTKFGRYFTYVWYPDLEDSTSTYVSSK